MLSDSSFPTGGFVVDPADPIPAPGQPIPPAGTKICGCQVHPRESAMPPLSLFCQALF
jgi:hypothetical protein